MGQIWEFVLRHGYAFLYLSVLVEQLGAPVPAVPVLLAMGALAGAGHFSLVTALGWAVVAATTADFAWYELGRRRGAAVLQFLCKLSLEPDSCVRVTRLRWDRWGGGTLLFAKFVPGLSTVAPPLAGITRMSTARFLFFDVGGSILWAGAGLGAGFLFRHETERILEWMQALGGWIAAVLGLPLLAYIAFKYYQRQRFLSKMRVARIEPEHLYERIQSGNAPLLVDLRSEGEVRESGRTLPGALRFDPELLLQKAEEAAARAELVFFCS